MKICFLASTFLPLIGGAEVLMHNLAMQMQRLGHEIHVITWWGNWKRVRNKLPYPIHPLLPRSYTEKDRTRLEKKGQRRSWIAKQVLFYHHLFDFDLVHIHNPYPLGPLTVSELRSARIPLLMTCTGGDLLRDASINHGIRLNPVLACQIEAIHS